jgi:hypothetical protein
VGHPLPQATYPTPGSDTHRTAGWSSARLWVWAAILGWTLIVPRTAHAAVCDPAICVGGNPCTIDGPFTLTSNCVLDLTGKDVTIAAAGRLYLPRQADVKILAHNLTIVGSIQSRGTGSLEIDLTGNLMTYRDGGGTILMRYSQPQAGDTLLASTVLVDAAGDVVLRGQKIMARGPDADLRIQGRSVQVKSNLGADQFLGVGNGSAGVHLIATDGSIDTTALVHANGLHGSSVGNLELEATGGDVVIGGPLRNRGDARFGAHGGITIHAMRSGGVGGNVFVNGRINSNGGFSNVDIAADENIVVANQVTARGKGGGKLLARAGDTLRIESTVTVDFTDIFRSGAFGGQVRLQSCRIEIPGTVNVRSRPAISDEGSIRISYGQALDLAGGSLVADLVGATTDLGITNLIECRCADAGEDGTCDGGCLSNPTGIAHRIDPVAVVVPTSPFSPGAFAAPCPPP